MSEYIASRRELPVHETVDDWIASIATPLCLIESKDIMVLNITDAPYELDATTDFDAICLSLGQVKGYKAWDTDRVTELDILPGRAYVYPQGTSVRSIVTTNSSFPMICVSKSYREEIATEFGKDAQVRFNQVLDGLASPALLPLAQVIRYQLMNDTSAGDHLADAIGVMVMTELLRTVANWDANEKITGLDNARLSLVLNYIEDEMCGDLSTATLAALAGISVFHFSRAFNVATGISPHRYVLERRVAKAYRLLSSSSLPLAMIAFEVGFSSQSHMTSIFKKQIGVTPARIRKRLLN